MGVLSTQHARHFSALHGHDDHDSDDSSKNSSSLVAIKVLSIIILFTVSASIGLFVLRYGGKHKTTGSNKWYHVLLRYANPFTGGLFLGLGLVHILPEANEGMVDVFGDETNDKYRFATIMAAGSFTFLLFLQRVVAGPPEEDFIEDDDEEDGTENHPEQGEELDADAESVRSSFAAKQTSQEKSALTTNGELDASAYGTTRVSFAEGTRLRSSSAMEAAKKHRTPRGSIVDKEPHDAAYHDADKIKHSYRIEDALVRDAAMTSGDLVHHDAAHSSMHSEKDQQEQSLLEETEHREALALLVDGKSKTFTAFVLLLALCIHSIAAGLALGLSDSTHGALIFAGALVIHKWAAALALGNSFALSPLASFKCAAYIVFFSSTTPLGIGLGWAAAEFLPKSIDAFLTSFTAGTFLYLASDSVAEEFTAGKRHAKKFGAFLVGLVLVYAVTAASEG